MGHRLAITTAALALAATVWCFNNLSHTVREAASFADELIAESRFDFEAFVDDAKLTQEESVAHANWVRDYGCKERAEYIQTYSLAEISKEFPVRAGMTIAEMHSAVAENERRLVASEFEQIENMYNLGWEQRSIEEGRGWVYFWVNLKHLFHCDIVIESGKVQSVWIMPGNASWITGIYYRISGTGPHKGPGRIW